MALEWPFRARRLRSHPSACCSCCPFEQLPKSRWLNFRQTILRYGTTMWGCPLPWISLFYPILIRSRCTRIRSQVLACGNEPLGDFMVGKNAFQALDIRYNSLNTWGNIGLVHLASESRHLLKVLGDRHTCRYYPPPLASPQ